MRNLMVIGTLAICVFALASCSSQQETKAPEPALSIGVSEQNLQDNLIAQKERDISNLQNRLDEMRDKTHAAKFSNKRTQNQQRYLNERYSELEKLKNELSSLRNAKGTESFATKQAELNAAIVSFRNRLSAQSE